MPDVHADEQTTQTSPAPGAEPVSRRGFLSGAIRLGAGAYVLLAGGGTWSAENAAKYDWERHRWAYLVDTTRCIGCGSCVRACKAENDVPDGFFRTWVERYVVGQDASHVDSPNGGLEGFPPIQTAFAPTKSFFVPKLCNHCKETPCAQVCPVGASYRTKDGVVLVDGERCIGCGYCVQACPYGSRFLDPRTHTASKCTWCYHRITKGMKPACVEACPTATRQFGDLVHEDDPVRRAIERSRVSVLQQHLLTQPQTYYVGLDKEVR